MSPKLMLFDIDGTLVHSHRIGTHSILDAINEVLGLQLNMGTYSLAGRTDAAIFRDLLAMAGADANRVDSQAVMESYLRLLEERLHARPAVPFPGVQMLLERLAEVEQIRLGLVTGNLERGAEIKLRSARLDGYFEVGAYGSDHEDRNELPPLAIRRAESRFSTAYERRNVIVIGDTPKDVECARSAGVQVLAVATGPYSSVELRSLNPDCVLEDLSDISAALEFLAA
jgi:phosphoglycolate phosphatase-like HAD superfamily hydrolase